MEAYRDRVVQEKLELENKVRALDKFIYSEAFETTVRYDEAIRMTTQLHIMKAYLDILTMRIVNF